MRRQYYHHQLRQVLWGERLLDGACDRGLQPTLCVSVLQKLKRPLENDAAMLTSHHEELNIELRLNLYGDRHETVSKFLVKIRHLVDYGAEVACLSQHVGCYGLVPVEEREITELFSGVTDLLKAGRGEICIDRIHVLEDVF